MSYYVRLYWRLIGAGVRGQMQYRTSFVLLTVASALAMLLDFVAVVVLLQHIPHLAGWSLVELALLYGLGATAFSVAELLAGGFDTFPRGIVQGTFDRTLVRPLPAFFQTFASELSLRRLGRVAQGLVVLAIAAVSIEIVWSADRLLVLLATLASGSAIFFGFFIVGAASSFWTVQANEAVNIFTHGGSFVAGYPLDVFHGWFRRLVTFAIPVGFINYYPALYLLDRPDSLGLPGWVGLLSPLAAAIVLAFAGLVWAGGVRRYQSTGS